VLGAGKFFAKSHTVQLYFEKSVYGLQSGSDVRFGGVRIGRVSSISVIIDTVENRKVIPVEVELTEKQLRRISGVGEGMIDFTSESGIRKAVRRGLRAGMKQESLVTGQLYVEFDIVPEGEGFVYRSKPKSEYPVVPTIPTEMDELIAGVSDGFKMIKDLELGEVITDLRGALQSIDAQIGAIEVKRINDNLVAVTDEAKEVLTDRELRSAAGNLNAALEEWQLLGANLNRETEPLLANMEQLVTKANLSLEKIEESAQELKKTGDPRSPVLLSLGELLHEMEVTSRSLNELTDDLKRNPNSLLRGKKSSP
jgi:paraquat-inducible protein B